MRCFSCIRVLIIRLGLLSRLHLSCRSLAGGSLRLLLALFFHSDVCDKQLDLYHHLKLYPEEDAGPQSTKKPVVVESYDEIVFSDPSESFFARVQNHPAVNVPRLPLSLNLPPSGLVDNLLERRRGDTKDHPLSTKDHPLSQWFMNFSEAYELLKLAAARQQIFEIARGIRLIIWVLL